MEVETIPLWTGRWRDVYNVIESGEPLHWTPTRISVGTPRYLPVGRTFPTIAQLAPYGLLKLAGAEFDAAYVRRLEKVGVDGLRRRFAEVYAPRELPILLLCFENVAAGRRCHRVTFAEWWLEKTGQRVREASL